MEYLFSPKKKEILQYGTKWMNLEDVMQSEIGQSPKPKYCTNFSYMKYLK